MKRIFIIPAIVVLVIEMCLTAFGTTYYVELEYGK